MKHSETDILLENLAEAIVEFHKSSAKNAEDPFDHYCERVQAGFFADEKLFCTRFLKGYHTLVNTLKEE